VTETAHQTLPGHPLQAKQVWSKSARNEGHFTQEPEAVFPPYLPLHFNVVTERVHEEFLTC
jgi:hypothetical protein